MQKENKIILNEHFSFFFFSYCSLSQSLTLTSNSVLRFSPELKRSSRFSRCQPFSITSGRVGDYRSSCIAPFEKRDERGRDIRDSLTNNLAMFSNLILMVAVLEVAINGRGSYYLTAEFVLVSSAHCASRKRSTQSQHGSL